jgi:uncharacterized protein YuzE
MQYFYDHQTDALSFIIGEFADYATIEEISPGIVMYLDQHRRAIAIEVRGAAKLVDIKGLMPLYSRPITQEEIERRMKATPAGERAWRAVRARG